MKLTAQQTIDRLDAVNSEINILLGKLGHPIFSMNEHKSDLADIGLSIDTLINDLDDDNSDESE